MNSAGRTELEAMELPPVWQVSFKTEPPEGAPGMISQLIRFLQVAAEGHAEVLGFSVESLQKRDLTWVLARFRLLMKRYPGNREQIIVQTWPTGIDRLFAGREYRISDTSGEELGKADSLWMMMHLERRRPARLPADFQEKIPFQPRRNFQNSIEKLEVPESLVTVLELEVGPADMDFNGHVNHARYLDWILQTVPKSTAHQQALCELVLEFRLETGLGTRVKALRTAGAVCDDKRTHFGHALVSADSDQILTVGRTDWTPLPRRRDWTNTTKQDSPG